MTRAIRLIQIIELLRDGCGYTTAELAERFGVSQRTIRDDLLVLQGEPFYMPLVCEDQRRYEWRVERPCSN